MLLGENLGLLCSVVVVVVGWLVARCKWRRAATRGEAIRRLMAFASEDTARAELEEASGGYRSYGLAPVAEPVIEELVIARGSSPRRKLQYKCEVCFSPTSTRCKQCKSVRYCSRKCQTFHWRQGHKDKCRSVTTHQKIDVEIHSRLKEFNPDEIQSSQNEIQIMHTTKPIESSSAKCVCSNTITRVPGENNVTEITTKHVPKPPDMNVKSFVHLPDESSSTTILNSVRVASDKNLKAGNKFDGPNPLTNVVLSTQILSDKYLQPDCVEKDEMSESSSSSFCSAIDSEEHFFEPSTPDFWAGIIQPKKLNVNALKISDAKNSNTTSPSLLSSGRANGHTEMLDFDMNRAWTDGPHPVTPMIPRKSNELSEVSADIVKSKEPLVLNCPTVQNRVSCTPTKCNLKEEAKLPSFSACHHHLSEEGHVRSTKVDTVSSLQSQAPKVVDREVGLLDTLRSRHKNSLASFVSSEKTTILDTQSMENGSAREGASCSLDRGGTNTSARRVVEELGASCFNRHGSLGAGRGIMRRYEVCLKGLFPYELFVKLYNWNKVELRPCGLKNCGNSCYANSVLQCLVFTPPLTAYFLQGLHTKTCHKKEWCFNCEFEELVKKAKEGNYFLSPAPLISQMQHVASHLGNGSEEDAHEFLRYTIDVMQRVCLKDNGVHMPSSLDEDTTLLGLTFGGYIQSKIECMRCGGKSKQHERIMDLTIEIGGEIGSLEDALRQFTRSEILDGENKYRCDRCKSYEKAKKKLRVVEAPNVLTIALKRFQSGEFGKLNKSVKFPEILNLAPYMRGTSDKSPIYQLYAAVIHLDVKNATFTGHYVCYIKNNQGRWYKADDTSVQPVELEKVLSNDAYMLFYARCSPRAPKIIRSLMDPRKSKNSTNKPKFHPTQPWNVSLAKLDNIRTTCFCSNTEDDCSTEYSSSSLFSEIGSHTTESSNTSTVDDIMFDHQCWINRTTSDSDTPSPSSSLSSPHRTRHSPLADLDRYSSDAGSSCSINAKIGGDGFCVRDKEFGCRNINVNAKGVYVGR